MTPQEKAPTHSQVLSSGCYRWEGKNLQDATKDKRNGSPDIFVDVGSGNPAF